jgi:hypothetical protein
MEKVTAEALQCDLGLIRSTTHVWGLQHCRPPRTGPWCPGYLVPLHWCPQSLLQPLCLLARSHPAGITIIHYERPSYLSSLSSGALVPRHPLVVVVLIRMVVVTDGVTTVAPGVPLPLSPARATLPICPSLYNPWIDTISTWSDSYMGGHLSRLS